MKKPFDDPLLGHAVLGRYRIVRTLARGGMGAVYLARIEGAQGFARPVVVKRVLPTLMGDPEVAQLFVREARILAAMQQPNIVSVLDFGQQDDGAYVTVFEYVNGYSLAEWCRFLKGMGEQVPVEAALHIVLRVLDALAYAHAFRGADGKVMQVVHRDVSPSNVLLSDQGEVKLLDFGIAQVSGDAGEFQTARPQIRGKLPYVPLEIFKGEPATVQSDLYAVGVVLYQLLTGVNPFSGRESAEIFHKVAHVTPASVHATREDAPEDIDEVLALALDRDPQKRYRNAAEFAEAVRALRKEPEDVVARRLAERLRRDFAGPMPAALGLEPLSAREAAWRDAGPRGPTQEDTREVVTDRPTLSSLSPEAPAVQHEAVTVPGMVSPALLTDTKRETVSEPARSAPSSSRVAFIAGAASLLGAGVAALIWLAAAEPSAPPPIVVVERASPAPPPKPESPKPPAQAPAAQQDATSTPASPSTPEPSAAVVPEAAAASSKRDPRPPNPRALTRAFERRQRQVESCFDRHAAALEGQPQLSLHFRISAEGKVLDAELSPGALSSTALGRCLLDLARSTRFQPQQGELSFHIPITAEARP